MRWPDPIRLRGTIVAVFVLVTVAIIYSYLDTEPVRGAAPTPTEPDTPAAAPVPPTTRVNTIPVTNRLCGMAQRAATESASKGVIEAARVLEGFYGEAAGFTDGPLKAELVAAHRYYKDLNTIGAKGNWDAATIVRNQDGERWRQLIAGTPTGVNEARSAIEAQCRLQLPAAPTTPVGSDGRILDPRLRALLDPKDKELPSWAATTSTR